VLAMPLLFAFRDRMRQLTNELEKCPSSSKALELCKTYGLLSESVAEVNSLGETPLIRACADGVPDDKLWLLLKAGSDVNGIVSYADVDEGMTPLLVASFYGRTSAVSMLAASGADVNAVTSGSTTTVAGINGVYLAAQNDFPDTVQMLHTLGADINAAQSFGRTPLYKAALVGHAKVVELLCSLGADMNKPNNEGNTPLKVATDGGHANVAEVLRRHGAT